MVILGSLQTASIGMPFFFFFLWIYFSALAEKYLE